MFSNTTYGRVWRKACRPSSLYALACADLALGGAPGGPYSDDRFWHLSEATRRGVVFG